jgi:uncharacterized membrane protein
VPRVGDFVAVGEPIFRLYAGAAAIDDHQAARRCRAQAGAHAEQDPMFAFRILVDIAIKTLSPAISDPTTAVVAIDQPSPAALGGRRNLRMRRSPTVPDDCV